MRCYGKMRKRAVPKRHPEIRCRNGCLGVHTPQQALTMIAKDKRVCRSKRTQKRLLKRMSAIRKLCRQKNIAKCGGHGNMRKCAAPNRHPEIRYQNCCLGVLAPQQALTTTAKDKQVCRSKRPQKRLLNATARAARRPQRIVKYIKLCKRA